MSHPDLHAATTPREALVAAVEQLRRIADALTTPHASQRREAPPTCGEECAEGHVYAGRCALADPPGTCTWPDCLTDGQQTELAEQVRQTMLGDPTTPLPDQRQTCGCHDNPAASDDGLREQYMAAIDAVTGGKCPMDIIDAVMRVRDRRMEQLLARIATLEHVARGNKRHVQRLVPDLERAEATVARVEALAARYPVALDTAHLLGALDGAQAPADGLSAEDWKRTAAVNGALHRSAEDTVTRVIELAERWEQHGPPPFQQPLTELRAALNDQAAPRQPVYDAVRDGHHDLDEPSLAGPLPTWTPPPPGATTEQLPAEILAVINGQLPDYTSTACQTADAVALAATYSHPLHDELREHAERLHRRCRLNQKFTGQLCACGCHTDEERVREASAG